MATVQSADDAPPRTVQPAKPAREVDRDDDNIDRRREEVKRRRQRLEIEMRGIDMFNRLYIGGLPREVAEAIAFSPVCARNSGGRFGRTFLVDPASMAPECNPQAMLAAERFYDVQWEFVDDGVPDASGKRRLRCVFLWGAF